MARTSHWVHRAMEKAAAAEKRTIRLEITPRAIGMVLAAVAAVWLLVQLWTIVVVIVVAMVLVGTLNPVVAWLERRRIPRTYALVLIFLGLLASLGLLVFLTIPPLVGQLMDIVEDAPAQRERLIAWLNERPALRPLAESLRASDSEGMFATVADYLLGYSSKALTVIGYGVTTLFLAFYILADGARAKGAVFALVPRDYHLRLSRIMLNLETIVGGYMRGQMITSVAMAVTTFTLLTILGVPNALSLAVFAGFVDVIPFIGGLLATVPAVAVASTQGVTTAIVVLVVMFIYQEFESRILVPRVYGRTLRLAPATVLLALLIGGTLLGIIGALLALPIAAGIQMIARELRLEMPGDDTDGREVRERDEAAEQIYEERSAGSPPAEAAAIATELAKEIRAADADAAELAGADEEAEDVPVTGGLDK